jgi:hypothetical protein
MPEPPARQTGQRHHPYTLRPRTTFLSTYAFAPVIDSLGIEFTQTHDDKVFKLTSLLTFAGDELDPESTTALGELVDVIPYDPPNRKAALAGPNKQEWIAAEKAELQSLVDNGTFRLVQAPSNTNVIGCKWVYKVKLKPDSTVD